MLVPKLVTTLKTYNREQFVADLTAGVIVGIVALPLAIAFAIASGLTPDRGPYTAVIAGFIISALGGSRVQIGGPTGAFVVIVYGIVQKYGVDGLMVAILMAGMLLIGLGLARVGGAIKFIPFPAVALSAGTLLIMGLWPRVGRKIPSPFVALIVVTVAAQLLHLPVETIGSRFGEIQVGIPRITLPSTSLAEIRELVGPAMVIAALGAIESLLS